MRTHYYSALSPCGFHRLSYQEWGDPANPRVLFCVHGLTRNSRDFDFLANILSKVYRVICPDVVGRGHSDWLRDPQYYNVPQYVQDLAMLMSHLHVSDVDLLGSSMGGLIGMVMASMPLTPVRRLILNDVGPFISQSAVSGMIQGIEKQEYFSSLLALKHYFQQIYAAWGPMTDTQWDHLVKYDHRVLPDGRMTRLYDPAIAQPFQQYAIADANLWEFWRHVQCPTLVLHGTSSQLLVADTIIQMQEHGKRVDVHEFPDCGHLPSLMIPSHVDVIEEWLRRN